MKREFIDYVEDILDAIDKIEQFTKNMPFEEFQRDAKTVFATVRAFEIIGEASSKLPTNIRSRFPDTPWKRIIGMRNILIHEYFGVDTEAVWKTIQNDLPKLKPVIIKILETESAINPTDQPVVPDIPPVLRDKRGRVRWTLPGNTPEENEQLGVGNIQALFLERFPEFTKLFPSEGKAIAEDLRGLAEEYILQKMGRRRKFILIAGNISLERKRVPYFEGSYLVAIKKSFEPWSITFSVFNHQVDKVSGIYTDENNEEWATVSFLKSKFGIEYTTIKSHLEDTRSFRGLDKMQRITTLYNVKGAKPILSYFASLPKYEGWTNEEREVWKTIHQLSEEIDVDEPTISPFLEGVSQKQGRSANGQEHTFYNLHEAKKKMKDFLARSKVIKETGTYMDDEGIAWAPANYFRKRLGIDNGKTMHRLLEGATSLSGRSSNGIRTILYNVVEARVQIAPSYAVEVQRKTQGVFENLYEHNYNTLYRRAYAKVGNVEDTTDLVQQAFENAWKAFSRFKLRPGMNPEEAQRNWLFTILNNLITDYYRSRASRQIISIDKDEDDYDHQTLDNTRY